MSKFKGLGLCAVSAVLCAALLMAPVAPALARNDMGQGCFYTYVADGLSFFSNCLSEKPTTVLLPEWDPGSDTAEVKITMLFQGGHETVTLSCDAGNDGVQVTLPATVECQDGIMQTASMKLTALEPLTEAVSIQVFWSTQADPTPKQTTFYLPVASQAQEPLVTEAEPVTGEAYRDVEGCYHLYMEGQIAQVQPISGTFPAFTWYSEDGGASWQVLAYESAAIHVNTSARELQLKGEGFSGGFLLCNQDGTTVQVDAIHSASIKVDSALPIISDYTAFQFQIQAQGVTVYEYTLYKDGQSISLSQAGFQLEERTKAGLLTISTTDRKAAPGQYTFVASVYLNGVEVEKLQTTFFVNYRYIG